MQPRARGAGGDEASVSSVGDDVPRGAPMMPEYAVDAVEVVIKGAFNPAIFSPAWLLAEQVIGALEYEDLELNLISRDFAGFRTGWLRCDVTPEACQLSTQEPEEFERLRDAAVTVLRALPKTPIAALGLNRLVHVLVPDLDAWHAIGDRLAPKDIWKDLLEAPGMRTVTVWGVRTDGYTGRIQVQVEPSFRVPRAVFMSVNDHFTLSDATGDVTETRSRDEAWQLGHESEVEVTSAKIAVALELLSNHWQASLSRSTLYIDRVLHQGIDQ